MVEVTNFQEDDGGEGALGCTSCPCGHPPCCSCTGCWLPWTDNAGETVNSQYSEVTGLYQQHIQSGG
jgi:hypothetical protein